MNRDAASWAAARCVGAWVQQQLTCLQGAKDLQHVADCLHAVLQLFISDSQDDSAKDAEHPAGTCTDGDQVQQQLLQHAQAVGWPVLQRCFFDDQYGTWATTVLTVAAGEWMQSAEALAADQQSLQRLIADTFLCSPAAAALAALTE
ncbi:hypothetical protein OEZ85_006499 [Tetradesmus obliquus]|uniref:Uncharacterized protein n=1 Tax=Tetradesmus obliquus TaxID=3088 RepID=A0ABY8TWV5_TETOB|nr:hypothetical protein OEZ85_006499 [Tetradesmus obliquus]